MRCLVCQEPQPGPHKMSCRPSERESAKMRPVPLTWALQKNGLASSKGDAQRAIINGEVLVNGVRATDPAQRLQPGDFLLQRNGAGIDGGEVRVKVGA